MVRFACFGALLAAGMAAAGASWPQHGAAATGGGARVLSDAAAGVSPMLGEAADLTLRFIQEGRPEDGRVRVLLTPAIRPLTVLEARSAAQRGFLEALNEPGLGDHLTRITVVVRLMPASHPDPAGEQVVVFVHKGGSDWSVLPGE